MKSFLTAAFVLPAVLGLGAFGYMMVNKEGAEEIPEAVPEAPELKFGFDQKLYQFEDYPIKYGSFMGDILTDYGVEFPKIVELEKKAEDVFSLRKIQAGKNITFVRSEECINPERFIYAPSKFDYVLFEFGDSVNVSRHEIPYTTCIEVATGSVEYTLFNAMEDLGFSYDLIDKLEDALSQVYFHHAQKGDQFKMIFEQIYVDDEPVSTGRILSAVYKSGEKEDYAFYYETEKYKGYYDLEGNPTQRTFLRAPVRFSRISSRFNPNRFHPVLKRRRAHLGTDYAAAHGTPIIAVADGTITKRSYTKGNGNYVKINHDRTYDSQYLHMSKFASGLRVGSRISRGQTIGYVGSTGLATGPHVCFRLWKNGRQIDHLRENFPPLDPMPKDALPSYFEYRDLLHSQLSFLPYSTERELVVNMNEQFESEEVSD